MNPSMMDGGAYDPALDAPPEPQWGDLSEGEGDDD